MARTAESIQKEDEGKVDLEKPEDIVDEGQQAKPDTGPTPEEVAADLRKQLEAANKRADQEAAARREAEEGRTGAVNQRAQAVQNEFAMRETAIASKIAAGKTKLESVKQQLKQAKAAGDGDAEVDLQDALTNARYELNAAEWEQNQYNTWKAAQVQQPQAAQQGQQGGSPYTKAEQAWIDRNPEFTSSKKFARLAKIAAQEAREDGIAQDSKAYFDYIESALKEEGLIRTESDPTSGAADGAGAASTAAAPGRSGTTSGVQVPSKNSKYPYLPKGFTIPKDWVDAAESQGYEGKEGALEYANDRLKIEQEEKAAR